ERGQREGETFSKGRRVQDSNPGQPHRGLKPHININSAVPHHSFKRKIFIGNDLCVKGCFTQCVDMIDLGPTSFILSALLYAHLAAVKSGSPEDPLNVLYVSVAYDGNRHL
ncbi:hypothetical protein AMECASPLE_008404, partial [Ameca splendens]